MNLREAGTPPGQRADAWYDLTESELREWGGQLGEAAMRDRVFVALCGPLGAGKTTLVRAACRGIGVTEPVLSPTFTLVRQYSASAGPVYHVDLYRVPDPDDLPDLGWEELLTADGPVFVEWADRAHGWLPDDRWDVYLEMGDTADTRRVRGLCRGDATPLPPVPAGDTASEAGDSPAQEE